MIPQSSRLKVLVLDDEPLVALDTAVAHQGFGVCPHMMPLRQLTRRSSNGQTAGLATATPDSDAADGLFNR